MTIPLDPAEGRRLYGDSPEAYSQGRPDYPEAVYSVLGDCGLVDGARVLEIGPGTGLVTRHLLNAGSSVTAVEANPSMAAYLRSRFSHDLDVIALPFEQADLGNVSFDLAVAATSFHWVEPAKGWPKLKACVRSGAWAVIWWMLFQDPENPDAFDWAIHDILGGDPTVRAETRSTPFQLQRHAREADFHGAGFAAVSAEIIRTPYVLTADQIRSLYATTAVVLRRPADEQAAVLDQIHLLVLDGYDGQIERTFVTALYRGRNG